MTFVAEFGNKSAGELIRAELWNNLMAALDTRLDALDASVGTLNEEVGKLTGELEQVQTDVGTFKGVLAQYFDLRLSTERVTYASGEEAVLVAQLRTLDGQPVAFADAQRPWVDFVTVWGHLRAADGFETQSGDSSGGEQAVSVRVNGDGIAHVLLRADVGKELPPEVHADVSALMTTKLQAQASIASAILAAPTPTDAKNAGAFTAIAAEYDRPAAKSVRSFLDTYYVHRAPAVIGKITPPIVGPRWRDYASVVVAVARADADPTTPDQARGAASIRVAFRDWIAPWLLLHYFDPVVLQPAILDFRTKLQPHFTADYFDSVTRIKNEVTTSVGDNRGLIGRIADLQAAHGALDGIAVSQSADLVAKVRTTVQSALVMQQALEPVQAGTFSAGDGHVALNALTDSSQHAAVDVGAVKSAVDAIQAKVDSVASDVGDAHTRLSTLDGRVQETSSTVSSISNSVATVHDQVTKVQELYPDSVKQQFLELRGAVIDVQAIKQHLNIG